MFTLSLWHSKEVYSKWRGRGEVSVSHGLGRGGPRFMNLLTLKFLIDSSDDFLIYCSKNVQLELLIVQKFQYMLIRIYSLICTSKDME